jgi:hypothetical protein
MIENAGGWPDFRGKSFALSIKARARAWSAFLPSKCSGSSSCAVPCQKAKDVPFGSASEAFTLLHPPPLGVDWLPRERGAPKTSRDCVREGVPWPVHRIEEPVPCGLLATRLSPGLRALIKGVVGAAGFEPATSWSQTKRSTKLSYAPTADGINSENRAGCNDQIGGSEKEGKRRRWS